MGRLRSDQVGRAGEYYVAAEVTRRGGYAVTFSGNMPGIDIIASDVTHERKITIQVKSKTSGDWQTSIKRGRAWAEDPGDGRYWVLVDLGPDRPRYFVVPAWWIENDIYIAHQDYLARHGGERAVNPDSTHHRITTKRVAVWEDRWDVLGILLDESEPDDD